MSYEESSLLRTAKARALYLLGAREYSKKGLYDKLIKTYPPDICDAVVAYVSEIGYLDEMRYAEKLAEVLVRQKRRGIRRAYQEMRLKGLPDDCIRQALDVFEREDILDDIKALLKDKYNDKLTERTDRQKTIAALMRRGYGYEDILCCIRDVLNDTE